MACAYRCACPVVPGAGAVAAPGVGDDTNRTSGQHWTTASMASSLPLPPSCGGHKADSCVHTSTYHADLCESARPSPFRLNQHRIVVLVYLKNNKLLVEDMDHSEARLLRLLVHASNDDDGGGQIFNEPYPPHRHNQVVCASVKLC